MSLPAWNTESFAKRRPFLEARGRILKTVRNWFDEQGFAEVETPCLQMSPGLEVHLKAFATDLNEPFETSPGRMYLHTSPEFAMKKLLAAGVPRLYQLARCFRNEERSPTHHPEFTMLEWYRANEPIDALMTDCEALLKLSLQAAGRDRFSWQGKDCDAGLPWQRISVGEAFLEFAAIDLLSTITDPDDPDPRPLAEAAKTIGIDAPPADRWEDIYFRIFLEHVEPHLGVGAPTFLTGYPLCMAALAKPDLKDSRLAQRFELYVSGLELANAFGELTDSKEQRRRFERDQHLKRQLYGDIYPIDEDFLSALSFMPESAGIALGFDRLAMLSVHARTIDDVIWLPVIRP
ncbi:Elongation factor P--(R)-beta-lysine ligase [Rhodospirillaceae bacterium LM-1]|nr:Elongation factor P--(R)-beta-lysine ligase [Rhodospirillaceae bacterium LM-1]